ncbi:MAG: hypothetical protein ACO1NO_11770 [Burkholderiaceae bacterium]
MFTTAAPSCFTKATKLGSAIPEDGTAVGAEGLALTAESLFLSLEHASNTKAHANKSARFRDADRRNIFPPLLFLLDDFYFMKGLPSSRPKKTQSNPKLKTVKDIPLPHASGRGNGLPNAAPPFAGKAGVITVMARAAFS